MPRREPRALSVRQPFAWLIVHGYKNIENRTWSTQYRGRLWIHASKKFDAAAYAFVRRRFPRIKLPAPEALKCGGLVGSVEVVDCVRKHPSPWYQRGNFGFVLNNARPSRFRQIAGRLGLFRVNR